MRSWGHKKKKRDFKMKLAKIGANNIGKWDLQNQKLWKHTKINSKERIGIALEENAKTLNESGQQTPASTKIMVWRWLWYEKKVTKIVVWKWLWSEKSLNGVHFLSSLCVCEENSLKADFHSHNLDIEGGQQTPASTKTVHWNWIWSEKSLNRSCA